MIYLLDSNVIIDYLSLNMPLAALNKMHGIVDNGLFISIISKIEVLGYNSGSSQIDEKNEKFISMASVFELSPAIAYQTITLRKALKIKLPDAIIASTALIHDLTLLTHNITDFNKIPGLNVLDSHSL